MQAAQKMCAHGVIRGERMACKHMPQSSAIVVDTWCTAFSRKLAERKEQA